MAQSEQEEPVRVDTPVKALEIAINNRADLKILAAEMDALKGQALQTQQNSNPLLESNFLLQDPKLIGSTGYELEIKIHHDLLESSYQSIKSKEIEEENKASQTRLYWHMLEISKEVKSAFIEVQKAQAKLELCQAMLRDHEEECSGRKLNFDIQNQADTLTK